MLDAFLYAWLITGLIILVSSFLTSPQKFIPEDSHEAATIAFVVLIVLWIGPVSYFIAAKWAADEERQEEEARQERMKRLLNPECASHLDEGYF